MAAADAAQRGSEAARPPPRPRSLLPREHGAYAEVVFPLITALALGTINGSAALLAVATIAAFLAHEPLLVLAGGRGGRARRETARPARLRAALLLAVGLAAGAAGLVSAPGAARAAALVTVSLAAMVIPLIYTRHEKTLAGELLVALAFASALLPVALAAGVGARSAITASAVWAIVFSLGTLTVRAVIANAKPGTAHGWVTTVTPLLCIAAIATALLLAITEAVPALAAAAIVPSALVALAFSGLRIHPRRLRRLGWSLVASNAVGLIALVVSLR